MSACDREEGELSGEEGFRSLSSDIRSGDNRSENRHRPTVPVQPLDMLALMDTILKSQNQSLENVLSKFAERLPPAQGGTVVQLPEFDPWKPGLDPVQWLKTVEICLSDNARCGSNLILTLSRALKSTAASWFTRIATTDLTWDNFKSIFTAEFDALDTPASVMSNLFCYKPANFFQLRSLCQSYVRSYRSQSEWNECARNFGHHGTCTHGQVRQTDLP